MTSHPATSTVNRCVARISHVLPGLNRFESTTVPSEDVGLRPVVAKALPDQPDRPGVPLSHVGPRLAAVVGLSDARRTRRATTPLVVPRSRGRPPGCDRREPCSGRSRGLSARLDATTRRRGSPMIGEAERAVLALASFPKTPSLRRTGDGWVAGPAASYQRGV